jgi:hypothetical protein
MHDTALTQVQREGYLPQIQPRSPSLAQQLDELLHQILVRSQHSHDLQVPERRPRGRPPVLSLPQLYLALLIGVLRQTPISARSGAACIWKRPARLPRYS